MGKELDNIDLSLSERKEITALLKRYLPDTEVWAYGSRVKFTAKPSSDLDLVAFTSKEQNAAVANLQEAFEESSLPFRVDLFIWDRVPKQFHKNIKAERVVLQKKAEKKNLPEGWEEKTLSEIVNLIGGGTPKRSIEEYWNGNIPWLSVKDFNNEYRHVDYAEQTITELGLQKSSTKILERGQLIISARGTVGMLAQLSRPMAFNQSCYGIDAKIKYTENNFLYYLIKYSVGSLKQITHGAVFDTITRETFNHITVNLPPLPEQKAIAHILGSLDNKIELNRRMNKTLEAMAQALFTSWFVDFDPVIDNALAAGNEIPEELKEKAKIRKALGNARKPLPEEIRTLFPSEFEYTEEMGWIPKGWRVSTVGEEFNVTMGQSPPGTTYNEKGEGVPFFQGRADFGFRYPSARVYCTAPKRFAEQNDTLVSVRAPVGDVNMAFEKCCIGRGVGAVRHKSASRSYTYYSMLQLRQHFNTFEAEGTVFGSISQKDFKSLKWLKSNQVLIELYEKLTGQFDKKIELCFMNISELSNLRDTLLPKLLSGEIRIPEAEKLVGDLDKTRGDNGKS